MARVSYFPSDLVSSPVAFSFASAVAALHERELRPQLEADLIDKGGLGHGGSVRKGGFAAPGGWKGHQHGLSCDSGASQCPGSVISSALVSERLGEQRTAIPVHGCSNRTRR